MPIGGGFDPDTDQLWYLIAALLFFIGLIGPAIGCLVLGALASLRAVALNPTRH